MADRCRSLMTSVQVGNRGTSTQTTVPYRRLNYCKATRAILCTVLLLGVVVVIVVIFVGAGHQLTQHPPPSHPIPAKTPYPGTVRPPVYTRPPGIPDYVWNMVKMMSDSHPCDDFYQYACGEWMDRHPATGLEHHSPFENMAKDIQKILTDLLGRPSSTHASQAVQKAKRMYKSCMNMSSISAQASEPLAVILNDINAQRDLVDMLVAMAKYNSYPLGIVTVTKDAKNTTRNVILMDQPELPLRKLLPGDETFESYRDFIKEVVSQLNWDKPGRGYAVVDDILGLISFQQDLTKLTTRKEDRPRVDGRYHMYTFGSLNDNFPKFDWKRYIRDVFAQSQVNINLTDDQPVLVYAPDYFKKAGPYMYYSHLSAQKDYARWKLVESYLPFLSERYRTARNKLLEFTGYGMADKERWEICTPLMDKLLPNITGRLYVEEAFDPDAMVVTKTMVQDIRKVFKERMQADSWMDSPTKKTAIEKLDAIRELIGYPADIMNDNLLDQQFEDLTITDQFFENVVAVIKRRHWSTLRNLHQPAIRDQWDVGATTVNAFYKPENNIIVIPAGILRKPVFSLEYPKSMIYSSLGLVVAHEITHGFDNTGRKFDKEGNLIDWWSDSALTNYKQKESCYVDQYSSYSIGGVTGYMQKLNGTKTLGENIADNGGIRDAFKAYTEWVSRQTNVSSVPYLGLSNNQVFYLAFAQRWCETSGDDYAMYMAKINQHSPGRLRVKGTLQNSNHFAQTYGCEQRTVMNPKREKCRIW